MAGSVPNWIQQALSKTSAVGGGSPASAEHAVVSSQQSEATSQTSKKKPKLQFHKMLPEEYAKVKYSQRRLVAQLNATKENLASIESWLANNDKDAPQNTENDDLFKNDDLFILELDESSASDNMRKREMQLEIEHYKKEKKQTEKSLENVSADVKEALQEQRRTLTIWLYTWKRNANKVISQIKSKNLTQYATTQISKDFVALQEEYMVLSAEYIAFNELYKKLDSSFRVDTVEEESFYKKQEELRESYTLFSKIPQLQIDQLIQAQADLSQEQESLFTELNEIVTSGTALTSKPRENTLVEREEQLKNWTKSYEDAKLKITLFQERLAKTKAEIRKEEKIINQLIAQTDKEYQDYIAILPHGDPRPTSEEITQKKDIVERAYKEELAKYSAPLAELKKVEEELSSIISLDHSKFENAVKALNDVANGVREERQALANENTLLIQCKRNINKIGIELLAVETREILKSEAKTKIDEIDSIVSDTSNALEVQLLRKKLLDAYSSIDELLLIKEEMQKNITLCAIGAGIIVNKNDPLPDLTSVGYVKLEEFNARLETSLEQNDSRLRKVSTLPRAIEQKDVLLKHLDEVKAQQSSTIATISAQENLVIRPYDTEYKIQSPEVLENLEPSPESPRPDPVNVEEQYRRLVDNILRNLDVIQASLLADEPRARNAKQMLQQVLEVLKGEAGQLDKINNQASEFTTFKNKLDACECITEHAKQMLMAVNTEITAEREQSVLFRLGRTLAGMWSGLKSALGFAVPEAPQKPAPRKAQIASTAIVSVEPKYEKVRGKTTQTGDTVRVITAQYTAILDDRGQLNVADASEKKERYVVPVAPGKVAIAKVLSPSHVHILRPNAQNEIKNQFKSKTGLNIAKELNIKAISSNQAQHQANPPFGSRARSPSVGSSSVRVHALSSSSSNVDTSTDEPTKSPKSP